MSQDLSTQSKRSDLKTDPKTQFKRDSAWQVAPTLWSSFRYAGMGLTYAFQTQRNFRIHTMLGLTSIALGMLLHLTMVELAVIGLTCGAVLSMELLNTALEAVVDLTVKQTYHDLAKIAKDCAAAAVLVSAIAALLVGCMLILPKLWILVVAFMSRGFI
jgi:diacylglycerol kinase (ATP)